MACAVVPPLLPSRQPVAMGEGRQMADLGLLTTPWPCCPGCPSELSHPAFSPSDRGSSPALLSLYPRPPGSVEGPRGGEDPGLGSRSQQWGKDRGMRGPGASGGGKDLGTGVPVTSGGEDLGTGVPVPAGGRPLCAHGSMGAGCWFSEVTLGGGTEEKGALRPLGHTQGLE